MIALLMGLAYLLGSIPIAWIVTKLSTGQDLRHLGSGNVGVMNVMIHESRWAGLLVFGAEALKGACAVVLAGAFGGGEIAVGVAVLSVVAGARWPVWLRFRGGRGNTAGFGALLVISWLTLLVCLALWGLLRLLTRDSFRATRLAFVLAPIVLGCVMGSVIGGLMAVPLCLMYLSTQEKSTDDQRMIKERWSSLMAFLTAPPRRHKRGM